jgi:hypothetical protein
VAIDETAALEVTAVRALEGTEREGALWTDADRAWASRVAAEMVGEGATPEAFLAARAHFALERIGGRSKALTRAVHAVRWRAWVGPLIVVVAFAAGLAVDEVGRSKRIELLDPPFLGLLLWNVAVYALLAAGFVVRYGDAAPVGPIRGLVTRLAGGQARVGRNELGAAIERFSIDWSRIAGPLYAARAARILHFGAMAFAAGLIAGLYLRGIALEYRATWESTFLDAASVRALLAAILAPGAAITGLPVPSVEQIGAIRAPASENAARWLHLMASTAAVVVIAPRLALALWQWLVERHRRNDLRLRLEEPYFARLLRGFRGGPVRVLVAPYSYALPGAAADGLERLIRSVLGSNASLTMAASTAYGGEDAMSGAPRYDSGASVIALFNAASTPERGAQGAFLDRLAAQAGPGGTLVALVDESARRERWGSDPKRLEGRRASWRALCADRRVPCAFVALAALDIGDATTQLERAIDEALR